MLIWNNSKSLGQIFSMIPLPQPLNFIPDYGEIPSSNQTFKLTPRCFEFIPFLVIQPHVLERHPCIVEEESDGFCWTPGPEIG